MTDAICWLPAEGQKGSSIMVEDGLSRKYPRKVLKQPLLYLPDIIREKIAFNLVR
jgi:hypothetical protein